MDKVGVAMVDDGFRIGERAAQPFLDAVERMRDRLSRLEGSALHQVPRLGSHDYGHQVAAHDQRAAESAAVVLRRAQRVLGEVGEALRRPG